MFHLLQSRGKQGHERLQFSEPCSDAMSRKFEKNKEFKRPSLSLNMVEEIGNHRELKGKKGSSVRLVLQKIFRLSGFLPFGKSNSSEMGRSSEKRREKSKGENRSVYFGNGQGEFGRECYVRSTIRS